MLLLSFEPESSYNKMEKGLVSPCFLLAVVAVFVSVCDGCVIQTTDDSSKGMFTELRTSAKTELLRIQFIMDKSNKPDAASWKTYRPDEWDIVTQISGQYILTSHPDIEFFSLGIIGFGIKDMDIPVVSDPPSCMMNITEGQFKTAIQNLLFSGLDSSANISISALEEGVKVCYEEAIVDGKHVSFRTLCCSNPGQCVEIKSDWWQDFLFYIVLVLNFIVFLYVANLVPEYLYIDKYGYINFYYRLGESSTFRVTDKTQDNVEAAAELEIDALQKTRACETTYSLCDTEKGENYKVKGIWFKAPKNRLVSKSNLPIGLFVFLYQRLFQCTCYTYRGHSSPPLKLKRLTSLGDYPDQSIAIVNAQEDFSVRICCDLSVCNPENRLFKAPRFPKWSSVLHVIMTICSAVVLAIPWIIIYTIDADTLQGKRGDYAQDRRLIYSPPFYAFNLLRFIKITVPGLSIAGMVLYVICAAIMSVILQIDEEERQYVGIQLRSTLRNAKDRWDTGVIKSSNLLVTLFLPFKLLRNYGLIALILWPFWILLVCPFTVIIALIGNTPTVNIFFRLCYNFIKDIINIFSTRQIKFSTSKSLQRFALYMSLICMLFIVHLFVFALVSLLVNIVCYTLVAVIVTAKETVRYTAFAVLIVLNARDCFLAVEQRYNVFNEKLQDTLLTQTKDDIKKLARRKKNNQPNTAFQIEVELDDGNESVSDDIWNNMAISEKNNILWNAKSVIQFLDNDDRVYLSEKFYFDACYMDYYGCPGDFSSNLLLAFRQVFVITAFLAFVVFTLNAYGGLEANSSSGLLVTLATGLLPLFVRRFFSTPIPELSLDTEDFNFQNILDNLIKNFAEYWEVIDLDVEKVDEPDEATPDADKNALFWLKLGSYNSVQLAVNSEGKESRGQTPNLNTDDIEMVVVDPEKTLFDEQPEGIIIYYAWRPDKSL